MTLLVGVSVQDAHTRRLSNRLVLTVLSFAAFFWWAHAGSYGLIESMAGAAGALFVALLPYAAGLVGAADSKIFAAYGGVVGLKCLPALMAFSCLGAGLLSIVYLTAWNLRAPTLVFLRLRQPGGALVRGRRRQQTVPLAVALSAGVIAVTRGGAPWQL